MIAIAFGIFLVVGVFMGFLSPATPGAWTILGIASVAYGLFLNVGMVRDDEWSPWRWSRALIKILVVVPAIFGGLLMFIYGTARL